MKKGKKLLALVLALTLLTVLLAGCDNSGADNSSASPNGAAGQSGGAQQTSGSTVPKVVKAGTVSNYGNFLISTSGSSNAWAQHLLYDFILEYNTETNEWESKTLTNWEWVDDTTLKMVLRDGILFSDGSQMTGEDILYTLQSHVTNGHPEGSSYFSKIDYEASYVEADGLTFYIVYHEVYGPALSCFMIPIMSKAFCEQYPDGDEMWYRDAVGSGPYKITEAVMDSYVRFEKRANYWNIAEYNYEADEVYVQYYTDSTAMFADYQAGNINVALGLSPVEYDQIVGGSISGTQAVMIPNYDVGFVTINGSSGYGTDIDVRKAVYHAVDWLAMSQAASGSLCTEATSHFESHFPAYTAHASGYDPELARQVLADAGYADGEVELRVICMNVANLDLMAEALQGYCSAVGITIKVEVYDPPTAFSHFISGDGDITFQGLSNSGGNPSMEPDRALSAFAAGNFPMMAIEDEEFNSMLSASISTIDQEERTAIYKQVDEWLYDNYYAYPMSESYEAYCYNTDVFAQLDLEFFFKNAYLCDAVFK